MTFAARVVRNFTIAALFVIVEIYPYCNRSISSGERPVIFAMISESQSSRFIFLAISNSRSDRPLPIDL